MNVFCRFLQLYYRKNVLCELVFNESENILSVYHDLIVPLKQLIKFR